MKLVQESMDDRGQNDPHDANKDEATEERVTGGEELGASCLDWVDWTHSSKNH